VVGSDAAKEFGANEWLVDEMYERFLVDPQSVDKAWWDFFSDFTPAPGGSGSSPKVNAPRAGTPPVPKSVQKAVPVAAPITPIVAAPATPVVAPVTPVVTPAAPVTASQPVVREVKQQNPPPADPVVSA
jgi:2-oxoglutarate decarboxylase